MRVACQTDLVTDNKNAHHRHDTGWPELPEGEHAVTELSSTRSGPLSPFGEVLELPLPAADIHYLHPITVPNR